MEELNRECHTTIVLATHDLELAARARRVVTLRDGRIESDRRNGHPGDLAGDGSGGHTGDGSDGHPRGPGGARQVTQTDDLNRREPR